MASEQVIVSEAIVEAVVEATRVAIQVMEAATADRLKSTAGPKIGGPAMRPPTFNWEVEDKYSEFQSFRLEVNIILKIYSTP